MNETAEARLVWLASLVSLVLGLSSVLLWLGVLTGLPALLVGLFALRRANGSEGRLPGGARLAFAGIVTGALGVLLTVVGIGAMVVLRMRDTASKVETLNNLRVMGGALDRYAEARGRLPAATHDPVGLPPERRISWMGDLLPFLGDTPKATRGFAELASTIDRRAAWDDDANRAASATPVRYYLVSSHPEYRPRSPLTSYVGLAGDGEEAALLKRDDPRAGVFGHDRGIELKEAVAGLSRVLAVIESGLDSGPWIAGGRPTVRGVPEGDPSLIGPGLPFGGLHYKANYGLWLDGSARFLSDGTEPALLHRIVRLRRE